MQCWLLTDTFQIVLHPFEQVLTPVPPCHVLNGFTTVTRILGIVFGPLVGIIVLPLTDHSSNVVSIVDVLLIPIDTRRSTKDHVRVNVPILKALNPVDASIVLAQCLVDVASLIVVIVHVRVEFAKPIARWSCKESFNDVPTQVVKIITVVIENRPSVIGVHHLASCFCATILVEEWSKSSCTGYGNDGFQILAALCSSFPCGCAFVGFPIDSDMAIAPILSS